MSDKTFCGQSVNITLSTFSDGEGQHAQICLRQTPEEHELCRGTSTLPVLYVDGHGYDLLSMKNAVLRALSCALGNAVLEGYDARPIKTDILACAKLWSTF